MADRMVDRDSGIVRQAARKKPGGRTGASSAPFDFHRAGTRGTNPSPRPIFLVADRLVQLWSSNEQEFAELRALRLKMARTRAYLASPGCNRLLGDANLERLETLHREHLARLRANRRAAWELVAELGAELAPHAEPQSPWTLGRVRNSVLSAARRHTTRYWYA